MSEVAGRRAALAEAEARLAHMRARYDVLMNAFKFDEARALAAAIEGVERERTALAATLPPPAPEQNKPFTVALPRRRRR